MGRSRLPRKVGGSVLGLAALGALTTGAEPASAATQTADYQRTDQFEVECQAGEACAPVGTVTCQIQGGVFTYDDGTVSAFVTSTLLRGSGSNCGGGTIVADITYDPDPSDPATSTFRLSSTASSELDARHVPAPNFKVMQYFVEWRFDVDAQTQTAGPYRLPK
jgi:hypothetical protein